MPGSFRFQFRATEVAADSTETHETVRFANDSTRISSDNAIVLQAVAEILAHRPELRLEVRGHADEHERRRASLGAPRAQAVIDDLVQRGVAADRLVLVDRGWAFPIDPLRPELNRRTDFNVISDAPRAPF
ncbi:MAG: OmpA family protein [Sandaracinaceae bacterium]|nr:OmpA family protein [Sandaracinaceae bacterium]